MTLQTAPHKPSQGLLDERLDTIHDMERRCGAEETRCDGGDGDC